MPCDTSSRKTRLIIGGSVAGFCVLLMIILLAVLVPKHKQQKPDEPTPTPEPEGKGDRIECPGFKEQSDCESHGCIYDAVDWGPSCYMEKNKFGYTVTDKVLDGTREKGGKLVNISADTPYGPSLVDVGYQVIFHTEEIVRIRILNIMEERYEVPVQKHFNVVNTMSKLDVTKLKYEVKLSGKSEIFNFQVKRKSDGVNLWDTSIGGLVVSDQFLQIASYLPSKNVYGLGEHTHETLRHDLQYKSWPMFARDRFPEGGAVNLYGVHPFYTCLENSTKSHGVLLLNSNAMEVTLMPEPAISFRTTGGIIDLLFFVGENPEHVIQLYTSVVGRPVMPPYWGLGFQLSKYGYNSLDNVKAAIERTRKANIAQDVQFLDIDHMQNNRDFTVNSKEFAGLSDYIKKTKEEYGLKWIIIIDPAIESAKGYAAFESGLIDHVFIKRSPHWKDEMFPDPYTDVNITFGKVWPQGLVAFPDFLNTKTRDWWINTISSYHEELPFDGLWIDMNEPSNFETNKNLNTWTLKCPQSIYEDPPYNPLLSSGSEQLSEMTLCMESIQNDDKYTYLHYDVHSLYGWSQSEPTLTAAQKSTGTRSLVISRSTYPSSGRYVGHWLGDNKSTWDDLRRSVIGIMEFNLFGIPYIGADVCGFFKDTTDELCKRWMQLGAFYPFFRNHNGFGQKDQDPGSLGSEAKEASQKAVERRYTLRPYLYTLFYKAHAEGSTVIRPLFHEFPEDEKTWNNGKQFMWGKCLLISPVLEEGAKSLELYLPKAKWWRFNYGMSSFETVSGQYVTANIVSDDIPLHVRSGCIIPTERYELNPRQDGNRTFDLYIFRNDANDRTAEGEIYIDSGDSLNPVEEKQFDYYKLHYSNNTFTISQPFDHSPSKDGYKWNLHIF